MKNEKKQVSASKKNTILTVIAILLMIGVGIWYSSYVEGKKYFVTDNAKVTAVMYTVSSPTAGKLVKYGVEAGSFVTEKEIIGTVEPGGRLRSPVNGQVVKSNATVNQMVSPSTPIAVIADTDNIYIGANIEETDIIKIKEGQNVIVELDAYPGQKFNAHVSEVDLTTQSALTGNATSFSTSGTYTKVTQLIPIKIMLDDYAYLEGIIGTNAKVKIAIK